jgi:hypothetical protein
MADGCRFTIARRVSAGSVAGASTIVERTFSTKWS